MSTLLAVVLMVCFLVLAALHFYWLLGGTQGLDQALPTDEAGNRVLNPGKIETAIVGLGLLSFAFYYLVKSGILEVALPSFIVNYLGWGISLLFILRAIGDFRYVGFFKKIKHTEFGKYDTKYFSILSLIIGIIAFFVELFV